MLWDKSLVRLAVLEDGKFSIRFADGSLSGWLIAHKDKFVLRYVGGVGPSGLACLAEGSLLARTETDVLEGECVWYPIDELESELDRDWTVETETVPRRTKREVFTIRFRRQL